MPDLSAPITPQEADRVWKSQARPSARTVATAMTRAGRPVHFTTVARWQRQGLLRTERAGEPRDALAKLPPPVTPLEAKRAWDQQRRPSSRSVAKALTRAGRPVHFTTVARWKKREWQVQPTLEHPLAAMMRKVDLFRLRHRATTRASVASSIGSMINGSSFAGLSSISLEYRQHWAKRYEVTEAIERGRVQI
jgi:hypothetical protein